MPDLTENSNNFPSTFSRASSQYTVVGSTLTEYATDVPAFGDTGLSCQVAGTNHCLYSDDLTNFNWTKVNSVAASGSPTTILGRACSRLTDSGSGGGYATGTSSLFTSSQLVGSVYMKCASGTVSVDLQLLELGLPVGSAETVTVTTSEQLFWLTRTGATFGGNVELRITINDAGGEIFVNLAQIESNEKAPSDPIPTTSSAATRAVSSLDYGVAGIPLNDISGSHTIRWANSSYTFTLWGGSSDDRFAITASDSGTLSWFKRVGGVTVATGSDTFTPPLYGTESVFSWELSSTTGTSATFEGAVASDANTADLGALTNIYVAGSSSSPAPNQNTAQVKNVQVTS